MVAFLNAYSNKRYLFSVTFPPVQFCLYLWMRGGLWTWRMVKASGESKNYNRQIEAPLLNSTSKAHTCSITLELFSSFCGSSEPTPIKSNEHKKEQRNLQRLPIAFEFATFRLVTQNTQTENSNPTVKQTNQPITPRQDLTSSRHTKAIWNKLLRQPLQK